VFTDGTPLLDLLGVNNYDQLDSVSKLIVQLEKALIEFNRRWKTVSMNDIGYLLRIGLVRELTMIDERKDAVNYRVKKEREADANMDYFASPLPENRNQDLSMVQSISPAKTGMSPSPTRGDKIQSLSPSPVANRHTLSTLAPR